MFVEYFVAYIVWRNFDSVPVSVILYNIYIILLVYDITFDLYIDSILFNCFGIKNGYESVGPTQTFLVYIFNGLCTANYFTVFIAVGPKKFDDNKTFLSYVPHKVTDFSPRQDLGLISQYICQTTLDILCIILCFFLR